MTITNEEIVGAFLGKITEFDLLRLDGNAREEVVDGFLRRTVSELTSRLRIRNPEFTQDGLVFQGISQSSEDELVNMISEGMIVQWLKPYAYRQENLENVINTRDFTTYSPSELLKQVSNVHNQARKNYTQMLLEYSYAHGDLTRLHL